MKTADEMFTEVLEFAKNLKEKKSKVYGQSWRKHGIIGALMNLGRKTDRIDIVLSELVQKGESKFLQELKDKVTSGDDNLLDQLIDTVNYAALCYAYLKEKAGYHCGMFEDGLLLTKLTERTDKVTVLEGSERQEVTA